ncbi:CoA pyrophosphatase [Psychromonas sp. MME2]|uniref:NUDIX hydrolase n=1 Tax=Psychromonas sp. MME2 TaxID=3231033 RepID=UPI00339C463E
MHLRHHPGQISFPGGKHEASDNSLLDTALRETEEEIGILQGQVDIFGRLPSLSTISGFTINPYLGFIDSDYQLSIDKQEVRSVFEVPLSYLLDSKNFHKQHLVANKQRHYTFCIRYQNRLIWGQPHKFYTIYNNKYGNNLYTPDEYKPIHHLYVAL